jgi:hypothetical protein
MKVITHGLKYTGFFEEFDLNRMVSEIQAFAEKTGEYFSVTGGTRIRFYCEMVTDNENILPEGYYEPALRSFLIELKAREWKRANVRMEHGIRAVNGVDLLELYRGEFFEIAVDREEGSCEIQCRLRERPLTEAFVNQLIQGLGLSSKPKKFGRDIPESLQTSLLCDSMHLCNVCRQEGVIIHHISSVEDGGKTEEDNLIVVCLVHHRQAHSRSALTKNLNPEHLREYKRRHLSWVAQQGRNDPPGRFVPLPSNPQQ